MGSPSAYITNCAIFISSVLFAVHPVHTEAVTGVVGRAELLSSIFFILSLLLSSHDSSTQPRKISQSFLSSLLFLVFVSLAVFSKEQGITVLGVEFCLQIFQLLSRHQDSKRKIPWIRLTTLVLAGLALLFIRFKVMGSSLPVFTNFDNPASYESDPSIRRLTWSYLLALNAWILLCPEWLCCDWTMGSVPLISGWADPRNVATLVLFALGAALAWMAIPGIFFKKEKHHVGVFASLALCCLPFLPASNLFFPVGFVIAERILYIPSMGFCLLVGIGFQTLYGSSSSNGFMKTLLKATLFITVMSHVLKCNLRNRDWDNELSIFRSGLRIMPNNAKLWNNVGHALEAGEDYLGALKYFRIATEVQEDDIGAYINVGRTYNNLGDFALAEEYYLRAKALLPQAKKGQRYVTRIAPQHLSVFLNLGNLISRDPNRLEEADRLYSNKRAHTVVPRKVATFIWGRFAVKKREPSRRRLVKELRDVEGRSSEG
ncbi:Uncharacterized protein FKW44_005727 [Caligus rogercresseyi]|uniref:dolichyl-phosphate-mannose--protein mannosyltransferase n=1 Tax=Caligus rogercresseyi TaxID=217165 RepID=A0A7T8KCB7_CALRO|nr:Uncharacterized protein FKW44_005727 [Caligus rogercresseyi]